MAQGMDTILRNMIADYMNVGAGSMEQYVLMGAGFNSLDENPNAQIDTKAYISDRSASNITKGYQVQFPFDTDLIRSEEAVMKIYGIGRNQKQGLEAEVDYVRVELFDSDDPQTNVFPARKFRVSVEVTSISGPGAEVIHVAGNLNGVGDFIDGEFNTQTKTFTPATF